MRRFVALTVVVLAVLAAGPAGADRRNFTFLYEPKTMAEGEMELEYYMTGVVRRDWLADEHVWDWAHQVELEYGITSRWDVSMYQMFGTSGWSGYKLRTRYRPFDYGEVPVEPLVYFEFIHNESGDIAFEEKLVLGTSFGPLVVALDSTVEQGPIPGDLGFKWIEAFGVSYEFAPWITAGLETQARMAWEPKTPYGASSSELEFQGAQIFTGPTVSLAATKFWWDLNVSFRLVGEDDDPKYLVRVLWGVFL